MGGRRIRAPCNAKPPPPTEAMVARKDLREMEAAQRAEEERVQKAAEKAAAEFAEKKRQALAEGKCYKCGHKFCGNRAGGGHWMGWSEDEYVCAPCDGPSRGNSPYLAEAV